MGDLEPGMVDGSQRDPVWVKLRNLATYLDKDDEAHGYPNKEVQHDLRDLADRLEAESKIDMFLTGWRFLVLIGIGTLMYLALVVLDQMWVAWVPLLLIWLANAIGIHRDLRKEKVALAETGVLLDKVKRLQKVNVRYGRNLLRRGAVLNEKQRQVDGLLMGIASGEGAIERVQVTLGKKQEH